jgi:fatty-acyl-CoA synthase
MTARDNPMTDAQKASFNKLNEENLDFLMDRYNRVNRWVIADMVRRTAYHTPDKTAIIFGDQSLTYAELEAAANRTANALAGLGVVKYDRVAILAHNTLHHVLVWLGCCKIGAVYLAINYLLRGPDITYCINHSESRVFIVEDALFDLVENVLGEMPTVETLIWSDQGAGRPTADDRFLAFDAWKDAAPATEPDVILHIEDPCQMTYTSGTESLPKGVIISNQALMAQYMGAIIDGGYDSGDINVNALPIYHCAQRDVFLNPVFWMGGTNILMAPDIGQILKTIDRYRANMFFAPPTVWIGILRHPDFDRYDLSCLTKCYYGASIMPVEVLKNSWSDCPAARFTTITARLSWPPTTPFSRLKTPSKSWDRPAWRGLTWKPGWRTRAAIPLMCPAFPARFAAGAPTP